MGLLLATFVILSLTLVARSAPAATVLTVNSTADSGDPALNGVCDVNPLPGVQTCTLRAAMQEANSLAGADAINFNIGGTGVKTIKPATALPVITAPVTINGYSQPGTSPNTLAKGTNANLLIELDLADAGAIEIEANNTVVRGLVLNNSRGSGVR